MRYDIDSASAVAVMDSARAAAGAYETQLAAVGSALEGLAGALGHSPVSSRAVSGYAQGVITPAAQEIVGRTTRALHGGAEAVVAYQRGDMFMASMAAWSAGQAPAAADMPGAGR